MYLSMGIKSLGPGSFTRFSSVSIQKIKLWLQNPPSASPVKMDFLKLRTILFVSVILFISFINPVISHPVDVGDGLFPTNVSMKWHAPVCSPDEPFCTEQME